MIKNSLANQLTILLAGLALLITSASCENEVTCEWPKITKETKPWTRWWWMGNAVNKADLTAAMEQYAKAGLGGVEITPIYGVKGYEDEFLTYFSPQWMEVFEYTLTEAKRLDMGVDMANASGWPFGGPWVNKTDESNYIAHQKFSVKGGEKVSKSMHFIQSPILRVVNKSIKMTDVKSPVTANENLQHMALDQVRFEEELPLVTVMAYSNAGKAEELTKLVNDKNILNWTAPEGDWEIYAIYQGYHGKMVERAAPGGEGKVIDHFSKKAVDDYLGYYDKSLQGIDITNLRAFFNDSYEVDDARGEANFTPELFSEFKARRGYDLKNYLPQFLSRAPSEVGERVRCDFRQTMTELLEEKFTVAWADWAHKNGKIIRNQSHGSPGNLIDLYAASDIPETEHTITIKNKLASSAATLAEKKLISCEAATWMDEHFHGSLADAKDVVNNFFLGGVNHLFYHGTTYSPQADKWPGWVFYASVHFGPTNTFWTDFDALNNYVARCQSFFQTATSDNDLLLYYPVFDAFSEYGNAPLRHFHGKLHGQHVAEVAEHLLEKGYAFDYVTDKFLAKGKVENGALKIGFGAYKAILIPKTQYITVETMKLLTAFAEQGIPVCFEGDLPVDVPGLHKLDERRAQLSMLMDQIQFEGDKLATASIGAGKMLKGDSVDDLLSATPAKRETMVDNGLKFTRYNREQGVAYFIINTTDNAFDGMVSLTEKVKGACVFNPSFDKMGAAKISDNGVYLQLNPGESVIVQLIDGVCVNQAYPLWQNEGKASKLGSDVKLEFISGGPVLPKARTLATLKDWVSMDDCKAFSGTARYTIHFDTPEDGANGYKLSLGEVHESARLVLNGKEVTKLIRKPYTYIFTAEELEKANTLEVYVSNLMVNRIIDLDQKDPSWKKFYNINFPGRLPHSKGKGGLLTTDKWTPLPSGLIGPVTLQSLSEIN